MDKKYTDNEIIKALEICILGDCSGCDCRCGSVGDCRDTLNKHSLDLITRQKAENEELISKLDELESEYTFYKISAQEQIEALIAGQETLQKYIAEKDAEIEKLKNSRDRWKRNALDFDEVSRETEKELERLYEMVGDSE